MFLAKIEHLARTGTPSRQSDIGYLVDGIWELRHHHHRFAFYDTPGDGTWEPKPPNDDWNDLDPEQQADPFWRFPHMDGVLRITNAWPKTEQRAPQAALDLAGQIREEDAHHDA